MIHTKNNCIKIVGGIGQKGNTYMPNPEENPQILKYYRQIWTETGIRVKILQFWHQFVTAMTLK